MSLALLALVAALALAVAASPVAAEPPGHDRAPGLEVDLRVASFNMAAGMGDLSATADAIEDLDADIVGLQEVDVHWGARSDFEDQAARLAEMLDMEVFFAPIYTFEPFEEGDPDREYGLAFLSDYPLHETINHDLTRLSTQGEDPEPEPMPGFPQVTANVKGVTVDLYNTHLDYRGDPTVRELQVDDTLEILGDEPAPAVLLGDLNAPPEAPELAPLFEVMDDAWAVAGEGDGFTFPAEDPDARIDYVLATPDIEVRDAQVVDTQASDHLPVVADLTVERDVPGH
ncbi:endonuclease/exonuclease/phosphatase family protein [Egibacter rhizosphaerae]|uniref:endonuclease/exonuclease/phosphatase family protein n=1 Tax=Egibacter rhizosphaerae TaxID=1670831 RepID=UPI00197ACA87|nr:endonuclease/exonuclease/phosphatase family protein [Egibacter rhizosphaerae]